MSTTRFMSLAPDVGVVVARGMPRLSDRLESLVAATWQAEVGKRGDAVFNGRVFTVDHITESHLYGHFTEYRRLIAQRRDPTLFSDLKIRSLAVSGLLLCADGVVFGRRGTSTTDSPGAWELAPSGVIDARCADAQGRVDFTSQLLAELGEELGLAAATVQYRRVIGLAEDIELRALDIYIELGCSLTERDVRAAHTSLGTNEYTDLAIVPLPALGAAVEAWNEQLVPTSLDVLRRVGWLR